MGKLLIAVLLAACQPMYATKAPRLKDPPPITHVQAPPDVHFVDECTVDFSAPAVKARHPGASSQLVVTGDATLALASKAEDDRARLESVRRGIATYGEALVKDPYNPEATLKLALAYDRVLRKGCALAMLKRLYKLAGNPTFKADASIDRVVDNEQWFKAYRSDALHAIGH